MSRKIQQREYQSSVFPEEERIFFIYIYNRKNEPWKKIILSFAFQFRQIDWMLKEVQFGTVYLLVGIVSKINPEKADGL